MQVYAYVYVHVHGNVDLCTDKYIPEWACIPLCRELC